MHIRFRTLFLLISTCIATAFGETGNIAGVVTDAVRHDALVGAQVVVEDGALRATTDEAG